MNRRILEDVKVNRVRRPVSVASKEDVVAKDLDNHNPTPKVGYSEQDSSSKYDFLNKKTVKTGAQRLPMTPQMPRKRRSFGGVIFTIFILSLIVGGVYLLSTKFLSAKVTVIAKNKVFELKHQKFSAGKSSSNIPFELMIVSDKEYKDVVLTNSKEASEKAKGEVTLYNEYSTKAQKLVAGTFLADEDGKSYKIDTTVTIPGYTLDKSKKVISGQVVSKVTSFLPGESYNGSPESFSITSFKGTDKFKKIYGKAKTEMTGGMTGLVYMLSEEDKEEVSVQTQSSKEKLLRKLSAQVPTGYILYPDAVSFTYESGENLVSKTPDTQIEMTGTLSAYLLKETDLSNSIIKKILPGISEKERAEIVKPDLSILSFDFVDKNQSVSKDVESFEFDLTGNLPIQWKPEVEELKTLLVSKNKDEVSSIFKQDPGILSAEVKIIPFWSKFLPENNKNINIILK